MLEQVSKSVKNVIVTVFIGLLLISLAIWGVSDAFSPRSKNAAAMVGGEPIELQDFYTQFNRRLQDQNRENQTRVTTQQAYDRGLHRVVLNQMITNKLLELDADSLGLDVNRGDARQYTEDLEIFNSEITGKLDEQKLMSRLSQLDRSMTRKKFEQEIRAEIRRNQVVTSLVTGTDVPAPYSDQQYRFMTEQRKAKLLKLDQNAVSEPEQPSDDEIKAYIEENQKSYIAPEYRRFVLLRLELSDVLPDIEVTDEELQARLDYKIKTKKIGSEETRSVTQYVTPDKDTANAVAAALSEGQSNEQIVSEFSVPDPIIVKGVTPNGLSDPAASEAAFKMLVGDIDVVEGSLGTWYILRVDKITPGYVPTLEDQRDSLTEEVKDAKAKERISEAFDQIQSGVDEGMTLEEAGREAKVAVASYDFISRIGQTENDQEMIGFGSTPGIATDEKIMTEIFTADPGFEGDLFETSQKGIAAVRVEEIKNSAPRSFESVKDKALANWRMEKINEALGELSTSVLKRVNDGESYETIAAEFEQGASVEEINMMRAINTPELSPQMAIRLFEARIGQNVSGFGANGVDRVIGEVIEITPNQDIILGQISDELNAQTRQALNADIQQAYRAALSEQYPTVIMEDNIKRVLGITPNVTN